METRKEYYRKVELGTGVQSFIKKMLESDIFNLTERENYLPNLKIATTSLFMKRRLRKKEEQIFIFTSIQK